MKYKENTYYNTINPENNNFLKKYYFLSKKDIKIKLINASNAFIEWKNYSFEKRKTLVKKLIHYMKKNIIRMSYLITKEMGKPIYQSKMEINKSINLCKYFCDLNESFLIKKTSNLTKNQYKDSYVKFEPIGGILGIFPWNYPIWQIIRSSIPNIILGNVMVIKPALNTTECSIFLEKIFINSGFPSGIFQILLIKNQEIEYVISNDIIQGVTFTGSTRSGRIIGKFSGKYIKKSVLELGGNDAFIVLKNVKNLNKIAKLAVESRLNNTGQTCISAKKFIVDNSISNDFIDLIIEEMKKYKRGNLYNYSTKIGYIARNDLSDKLHNQYKYIINNGAKVCLKTERNYNFFSPSLLKIENENFSLIEEINKEEIFGPIGILIPFNNEVDIYSIVNNTPYGLGASIWTDDYEKALKMSKNIEVGMVFINEIVKSDHRLPFGGIKNSGYGRELSSYSIREFSNWKTIVIGHL